MVGKFGKCGLKVFFVFCVFICCVIEVLDYESMNEDFCGCSCDNKLVFIEEINE